MVASKGTVADALPSCCHGRSFLGAAGSWIQPRGLFFPLITVQRPAAVVRSRHNPAYADLARESVKRHTPVTTAFPRQLVVYLHAARLFRSRQRDVAGGACRSRGLLTLSLHVVLIMSRYRMGTVSRAKIARAKDGDSQR
jgi:hypothetical protein